jgi:hypothetical protein
MAIFGTKEERKLKKILKNYQNLYSKLFYIEKVGQSVIKELQTVTNSQLQAHITDIEIACVNIDAAMRELSKSDIELYQKFFNQIPKFSSFDQGADFISGDSRMYILPEHNSADKIILKGSNWRDNISKHSTSLQRKIKYASFINKENIEIPKIIENDNEPIKSFILKLNIPKKLKALSLYDISKIEEYNECFNKFFYKTYEMMYNNFVFAELPNDYSNETLEIHSLIQFLIEKSVINKENPYKTAVYELPEIIKPYASTLGLFTVESQK